ncbi:6-hydroxymethylpterin diphosphokinase MptE-like protein [Pareuzebyella sediminis]|uniref:6-hydroxymethylpterin diphosphokinase MptE-like protein n=1 Tax=Pareuzebyella sediminis TaxID=2607998 RepID=UPI0011EDDDD0|nr:6-hydroxymethylpterin diphosphokinase MptE-like protein [Pareuzebyella sediminis]
MFGRRERVAMSVVNFIENYLRDIQFYMKFLMSKDLRSEMSRNKMLKDSHSGQRCFIVGNGPSLKYHDLTKLTNEHVFTVNYIMKSDYFEILNSDYHLFFDPVVFGLDAENKDDQTKIDLIAKTKETNPKMTYIIPYRRRSNFLKLFPHHKFIFIYNRKTYTPWQKKASSLHRITPGFQNVIVYAINTALYMGFSEIYLLGVDMTGFLEHFEYNKVNDQWGHSYSKTQEEKESIKKILLESNIDNEFYLKTYGKTFEHLKTMYTNVLDKNAKLYNASEHGALDFIPRVDYERIFSDHTN